MASACDETHLDNLLSYFTIPRTILYHRRPASLNIFRSPRHVLRPSGNLLRASQLLRQTLITIHQLPNPPLQLLNIPPPQLMLTNSILTRDISAFAGPALRLDLVAADFAAVTSVAGV
ncbi:hypothetical protein H9Q73_010655 [Fusarium xylarioides]|nr:hypothetical protein H9Q73_010655 [Fusarium xylarioides]